MTQIFEEKKIELEEKKKIYKNILEEKIKIESEIQSIQEELLKLNPDSQQGKQTENIKGVVLKNWKSFIQLSLLSNSLYRVEVHFGSKPNLRAQVHEMMKRISRLKMCSRYNILQNFCEADLLLKTKAEKFFEDFVSLFESTK